MLTRASSLAPTIFKKWHNDEYYTIPANAHVADNTMTKFAHLYAEEAAKQPSDKGTLDDPAIKKQMRVIRRSADVIKIQIQEVWTTLDLLQDDSAEETEGPFQIKGLDALQKACEQAFNILDKANNACRKTNHLD
jgi:hypothetical protein